MVLPKYQQPPQRKVYAGGCVVLLLLLMVRSANAHVHPLPCVSYRVTSDMCYSVCLLVLV